jgi:carbohydrate-selective porin OprB
MWPDLTEIRRTALKRFCYLALAAALTLVLNFELLAEEKESLPPKQPATENVQELSPSEKADAGSVEQTRPREWFGSELSWWEWSHLTGDWGGWRSTLKDAGITIDGSEVFAWSNVASGGIRRRSTVRNLLDFRLTVDLKSLTGVDAGTVWARYYGFFGRNASKDAGDIQGFSNIDSDRSRQQLAELWYETRFLKDLFRLKVGKVDANTEFAFAENAAEFLNSSMGFSPTIFPLPTYPDPAMGINLFTYPTENLYVGFGAYDGAGQRGVSTGSRGPATFFHGLNKLFYVGEVGGKWTIPGFQLPGRLGIGGWHYNGSVERFDGGKISGSAGFYLVLDQMIWRAKPLALTEEQPKGIGMFFQYGFADAAVSEIKRHLGTGLVWRGPLPGREDDALGWGLTSVRLSDAAGAGFDKNYEVTVESFYKIQITPWVSAKPNLQYIINPSGARDVKNALVPSQSEIRPLSTGIPASDNGSILTQIKFAEVIEGKRTRS